MPAPPVIQPALIGPYGPAQIACLRSWRRLGMSPLFIHIGDRPLPLARWVAAATLHLPAGLAYTAVGISHVAAFLTEHGAHGITCLSEALAFWLHEARRTGTLPPDVALWVPDMSALTCLASKAAQLDVARTAGLDLLPTYLVGRAESHDLPDNAFPIVLRPDNPAAVSPSFKAQLVPDRRALTAMLAGIRRLDRPLVGQRYIKGPNVILHGARSTGAEVFALRAFLVDRKFEGMTLTLQNIELDPGLADSCSRYAEFVGVTGCFHFEFIRDACGRLYFLEMNGRLGGTTAKVFALGYDEPRNLLAAYGAASRADDSPLARGTAVGRQALVKATLQSLHGRRDLLDYPGSSATKTLLEAVWGLLWWHEETYRLRWPITSLAYLLDILASLWSKARTKGGAGPRGEAGALMTDSGCNVSSGTVPAQSERPVFFMNRLRRVMRAVLGDYLVFVIMAVDADCRKMPDASDADHLFTCATPDDHDGNSAYGGEGAHGFTWVEDGERLCICWVWHGERYRRYRDFWPLAPDEAKVIALETRLAARGRGIAPKVIAYASEQMARSGFVRLYARIWHSNKASLRAFSKAGWYRHALVIEIFPCGRKIRFVIRRMWK